MIEKRFAVKYDGGTKTVVDWKKYHETGKIWTFYVYYILLQLLLYLFFISIYVLFILIYVLVIKVIYNNNI